MLLYLHNHSISPHSKGGLNTTLLQVFSMCNAFSKAGLRVKLYIEGSRDFDNTLNKFIQQSFKEDILFEVGYWEKKASKRIINRYLIRGQIKKIVEREKPDIVFVRDSTLLRPVLSTNTKVIYESHNAKQHNRYKFIHNFLQHQTIKKTYNKNFVCLFTISNALATYWKQKGACPKKIFAWHDGFDSMAFEDQLSKEDARNLLNLKPKGEIATYTGGLYPDREIENIIELARKYSSVMFLVIGGPEKNKTEYQKLASTKGLENIIFTGLIPHNQIPYYLYASDVLLALWSSKVPTINYCSPLKLFEYMASGRTILAHDFPTIKEVLIDGVDAVLCKPDNFDSLSKSFDQAINHSREMTLGQKARDKAYNLYSWDKRVSVLLSFIKYKI